MDNNKYWSKILHEIFVEKLNEYLQKNRIEIDKKGRYKFFLRQKILSYIRVGGWDCTIQCLKSGILCIFAPQKCADPWITKMNNKKVMLVKRKYLVLDPFQKIGSRIRILVDPKHWHKLRKSNTLWISEIQVTCKNYNWCWDQNRFCITCWKLGYKLLK